MPTPCQGLALLQFASKICILIFMWGSGLLHFSPDTYEKKKKHLKIRNEMFPNLPAFLEHGLIKRKHHYEIAASLLCLTFPLEGCLPSHLLPRRASLPLVLQIELMSSSCHGDSAELLPHCTGSLTGRGNGSPRRQPAARCQSLSEDEHLNKDAGAIKGRLRGLSKPTRRTFQITYWKTNSELP